MTTDNNTNNVLAFPTNNTAPAATVVEETPTGAVDAQPFTTLGLKANEERNWTIYGHRGAITLPETIAEVERRETADGKRKDCQGFNLKELTADVDPNGFLTVSRGKAKLHPRLHAFNQLSALVKAPAQYLRRLPTELALECLNHGFKHAGDRTATARCAIVGDGDARTYQPRAFVSSVYGAFDNLPMLRALNRAVDTFELGDVARTFALTTGTMMQARVMLTDAKYSDPNGGGEMWVGFNLRNSELGQGALYLDAVLYQGECTNGCIWQKSIAAPSRWIHKGDPAKLEEGLLMALPQTIATCREMVGAAAAAQRSITTWEKVVAELDRSRVLTQGERESVKRLALQYAGYATAADLTVEQVAGVNPTTRITRWNVISAITEAAQAVTSSERRVELEVFGGSMLRRAA